MALVVCFECQLLFAFGTLDKLFSLNYVAIGSNNKQCFESINKRSLLAVNVIEVDNELGFVRQNGERLATFARHNALTNTQKKNTNGNSLAMC